MMMRYAILVALAAASVCAVFNLGTTSGEVYVVDAGQVGAPGKVAFWLLAGIATLITLSLCRFVIFGLPSMVDDWYRDNKAWLYTALVGGLIYGAFYFM